MFRTAAPFVAVALAGSMFWLPSQGAKQDAHSQPVRQEAREAGDAIRDFAVERRDEAVANARRALSDLDARIDGLAEDIDKKWEQLDDAARRQARDALGSLRTDRAEAARWLDRLKRSSEETWEEVKVGFTRSYQTLKDKLARTKDRL